MPGFHGSISTKTEFKSVEVCTTALAKIRKNFEHKALRPQGRRASNFFELSFEHSTTSLIPRHTSIVLFCAKNKTGK